MEKITMCFGTANAGRFEICLKLVDHQCIFYHSTGIFRSPNGVPTSPKTRNEIERHYLAMCKAYTLMQLQGMNMDNRVFESEVERVLTDVEMTNANATKETLSNRFVRYLNDAHRDGVIGDGRYAVAMGKANKLKRFLAIIGQSSIATDRFTAEHVLKFRQFVYEEYKYVPLHPELYPCKSGYRAPKKHSRNSTVVHDMKLLQAFFAELENTGEIEHSPFRKISAKKRRSIMRVMYDDPVFLRAEEFRQVLNTAVPANLQWAKDIFVLNCAIGCRISDLLRLTPDKVAVSDDGIPYVHYIPTKTIGNQTTNKEIITPLIEPAVEIINRTKLKLISTSLDCGKQRYNRILKELMQYCGINRQVNIYNPDICDNVSRPIYEVATSKLARKTHIDMLNKVQINYYVAGLHSKGSEAVFRYTSLELADRYALLKTAFSQE